MKKSESITNVWQCKVAVKSEIPNGFDLPMREALAFVLMSHGIEIVDIYSGWGSELSTLEKAITDNEA